MKGEESQEKETHKSNLASLQASIVVNWNLPSGQVRKCVHPERWPAKQVLVDLWPSDVLHLLLQASELSKGNHKLFQDLLSTEVAARQERNTTTKGKTECMTATDLKRVCKRLEELSQGGKATTVQTSEQKEIASNSTRQGRSSNRQPQETQSSSSQKTDPAQTAQGKKAPIPQGRSKAKNPKSNTDSTIRPATKRTASDLPLRPARKQRTLKSPKPQPTAPPPPVTPANPPSASDEEDDDDQENAPPEPVSGRHIYGDYIAPTTISFHRDADEEEEARAAAAQPRTRQTRKRVREEEKPPVEVQIDSDPRDIDATGFLSELDPKEAQGRRRRRARLSRLQVERQEEPAWSQDVPVLEALETPGLTPGGERIGSETPAALGQDGAAAAAAGVVDGVVDGVVVLDAKPSLGLELLIDLLPGIPDGATEEERELLKDRVALLHRDIIAYRNHVWEIEERGRRETE